MKIKLLISFLLLSCFVLLNSFGAKAQGTWTQKANFGGGNRYVVVGSITLNLSSQPKGIYFYTLRSDNATIATGKLIIQ